MPVTVFCTVLDDQGAVESEQRYLPACMRQVAGERYAAGIDETEFGYTGQRDLQLDSLQELSTNLAEFSLLL